MLYVKDISLIAWHAYETFIIGSVKTLGLVVLFYRPKKNMSLIFILRI